MNNGRRHPEGEPKMLWIIISAVTSQSGDKVTPKKQTTEKRDSTTLAEITGQDIGTCITVLLQATE